MKLRWWGAWLVVLMLGYALFYGALLAEWSYSQPRGLNVECMGMAAELFRRCQSLGPVGAFAEGIGRSASHLNLAFLVAAVTLLGIGYLLALRAIARRPEAWPLPRLARAAALAGLPLLLLLPPTSVDYLAYLFAGRIAAVYHVSPWHHTLAQFPAEHNYLSPEVWAADLNCIYGPVWVAVMAAVAGLANLLMPGDLTLGSFLLNVLLLRAANLAALAAAALAVWQINGLLWPRQQRLVTAAFLFNPLLVYEAVGALHNDVWGVACLLWACCLFLRNDTRFLWPLGLSILTKYVVFALAPLFAIYFARRREWPRLAGLAATVLVCLAITQLTDPEYLTSRLAASAVLFTACPTSLPQAATSLVALVRPVPDMYGGILLAAKILAALFLPFYAALVWRTRTREGVIRHGMWVLVLYFAGVYLQTMQWYFVWPLGLLCAVRWSRAAATAAWAACFVLLGYFMNFWNHNGYTAPTQVASYTAAILLPALAILGARWGWWSACAPPGEGPTRTDGIAGTRKRGVREAERTAVA